jgi:transketolase
MIKKEEMAKLKKQARRCRRDILEMTCIAQSGHPGGSLSAIDIMVTLYFWKMRLNPKRPSLPSRDRFILSKGHCCPALYSCLARRGYFSPSLLKTFRKPGSPLQGHPEYGRCKGVEASSGPLGQGLGVAVGMALAARLDSQKHRIYVMLGDGECDEGNIWESAMAASHFRLDNITAILDHNGLQIDGFNSDVMEIEPIAEKFRAFGWNVINIDGHDFVEITDSLELAERLKGRPTIIIAKTIKGKGVKLMENKAEWHGKAPSTEELKVCMLELDGHG